MPKDGSRRSSAAASTHTNSPHENGDVPAQEPQQTSEAGYEASLPAPSKADSVKSSTANGTQSRAAESQPMTASNSTSSDPSTKDAVSSGTGPAVYGTRSRNRTGNSRPNYAEDKELDVEFELASSVKESNGRKPARVADSASTTEAGQAAAARGAGAHEPENTPTVQSHHKESIPGTSTFSANPTATGTHSKKRKGVNQAASQPQLQVPTQNTPQAVTRRASMATHMGGSLEDSNMLSFENCGGRLKNNKLVADDGTVLEVNGQ